MCAKDALLILYYYNLIGAHKTCLDMDLDSIIVPATIAVRGRLFGKPSNLLVQRKVEVNRDPAIQKEWLENKEHQLDKALQQYLILNQIVGIATRRLHLRSSYVTHGSGL